MAKDEAGPVLEVRLTYRTREHYTPGSLELYDMIQLPPGATCLDAATVSLDLIKSLREGLTR